MFRQDEAGRWHATLGGVVILAVLVILLGVLAFGAPDVQRLTISVVGLLLLVLVAGGLAGGRGGRRMKTLHERRADFGPRDRSTEFAQREALDREAARRRASGR